MELCALNIDKVKEPQKSKSFDLGKRTKEDKKKKCC